MPTADLPRRISPVHESLEHLHARWAVAHDMPVAADFGDPLAERAAAERVGLCDVSALPRVTIKGPAAASFLADRGLWVPDRVYGHFPLPDGGLIVRTGGAEFFIEDAWQGGTVARLIRDSEARVPGVYPVPRQDVSIIICGGLSTELLAQTCSYDFAAGGYDFVMTQVAGVSCAVLPRQVFAARVFRLWADGTYGHYLWEALIQIARELGGGALGLTGVFYSGA